MKSITTISKNCLSIQKEIFRKTNLPHQESSAKMNHIRHISKWYTLPAAPSAFSRSRKEIPRPGESGRNNFRVAAYHILEKLKVFPSPT